MNKETSITILSNKRRLLMIIVLLATGILLFLWFFVVSPSIFSNKMLADIYPGNSYDRGIKGDDYVPNIPVKDVEGKKAVILLREVNYNLSSAHPVDWSCNSKYLPDSYKTNNPDEVKYIVYVNKVREKVGSYTNKGNALRIDFYVSIIDRTTGEILASKTFDGERPPSSISSNQGGAVGSEPSAHKVTSWVSSVLP